MIRLLKTLWYVVNLRCEEADRVRCACCDGDTVRWWERFAERAHSFLCSSCRAARKQLRSISSAIQGEPERFSRSADDALPVDRARQLQDAVADAVDRDPPTT